MAKTSVSAILSAIGLRVQSIGHLECSRVGLRVDPFLLGFVVQASIYEAEVVSLEITKGKHGSVSILIETIFLGKIKTF